MPASSKVADAMEKLLVVWPERRVPSLNHAKLKGPPPDAAVLNSANVPRQFERLVNGVALRLNTVNVALRARLSQAPLTVTVYIPASVSMTESLERVLFVSPLRMLPSLR